MIFQKKEKEKTESETKQEELEPIVETIQKVEEVKRNRTSKN